MERICPNAGNHSIPVGCRSINPGGDEMNIEQQIATKLHDMICRWNHTDGCDWYYFPNDWTNKTHADYLRKARGMIKKVPVPHTILRVLEAIPK